MKGMPSECVFCEIAEDAALADVVYDGGDTLFFNDISPQARVHVVGITKKHIASLSGMEPGDERLVAKLLADFPQVAKQVGVEDGGYRVITNNGPDAGQEVKHLHWHLLGGEKLGPLN